MEKVKRVYVKKREGFDTDSQTLLRELKFLFGLPGLKELAIVNRYDVENTDEATFREAVKTIFSDPGTDLVFFDIEDELKKAKRYLPVEYLDGQYD